MTILINSLRVEFMKLKRTLSLWLVIIAPLTVVMLQFINYAQRGQFLLSDVDDVWPWMAQNILIMWSFLMLPLFVALETALLASIEHNNHQWKHIYTLPVPRWMTYVAKLLVSIVIIGISSLVLFLLILAAGMGLRVVNPGLGFEATPPVAEILLLVGASYVAAWLMIAIHTWIAIRWPSFVLAIGISVVGLFGGFMLANTDLWRFYPWSLPTNVENILYLSIFDSQAALPSSVAIASLVTAVVGGMMVAIAGAWDVTRRDVL